MLTAMRWLMVVVVAACSSRESRESPRPPTAEPPIVTAPPGDAAPIEPTAFDEETADFIDRVKCSWTNDHPCHNGEDHTGSHKWSPSGAVGIDWKKPEGIVLAKLSLDGDRWVGDLWFASEIEMLVDDRTGSQRPATRIASVDTGVNKDERKFEYDAIVGLAYTDDGFVFVAGSERDIPGTWEVRKVDATFYRSLGNGRFEPTKRVKMTTEYRDGERKHAPGWVDIY